MKYYRIFLFQHQLFKFLLVFSIQRLIQSLRRTLVKPLKSGVPIQHYSILYKLSIVSLSYSLLFLKTQPLRCLSPNNSSNHYLPCHHTVPKCSSNLICMQLPWINSTSFLHFQRTIRWHNHYLRTFCNKCSFNQQITNTDSQEWV